MKLTAIYLAMSVFATGCYTQQRPFKMMNGYGQLIAVKTSAMEKPHYGWDVCMKPLLDTHGKEFPAPPVTKDNPYPLPPCAQEQFWVVDSNGSVIATWLGPLKDIISDLNLTVPVPITH